MCSPMAPYVQSDTYVCITRCVRTHFKSRCMLQKDLDIFKKHQSLFRKARHVFYVREDGITLTKPVIPFFRSSLQLNQNTLSINRLTMTGYPFILLSVVLPKLLSNLSSVFICIKKSLTDERRLKRQYEMSIHYRNPP